MRQLALFLLLSFSFLLLNSSLSLCAEQNVKNNNQYLGITPQEAKKMVEKISSEREEKLGIHTETRYKWVLKKKKEKKEDKKNNFVWLEKFIEAFLDKLEAISKGLGSLGSLGRIMILAFLCIVIISYLIKSRFFEGISVSRSEQRVAPQTLFGMDIRPESIPDNPEKESLKLWKKGEQREALALLYRSTLSLLIYSSRVPIHSSFTELECQRKITEKANKKEAHYFKKLTYCWIRMAYAHRIVTDKEHEELVQEWKQVFSV